MYRLKELRKSKGMSQQELADYLFVNQTAVSQWERGVTTPGNNILIKLCELFNVTSDYLLGIDSIPKNPIIITQHGGDGPIIVRNDKKTEREKSLDALVLACQKLSPEQINALLATAQLMTPKDGKE